MEASVNQSKTQRQHLNPDFLTRHSPRRQRGQNKAGRGALLTAPERQYYGEVSF